MRCSLCQVVYEDFEMVQLTQPYIAGFLAFREVDFIVALVAKLRDRHPSMQPQVQHTTCAPLRMTTPR